MPRSPRDLDSLLADLLGRGELVPGATLLACAATAEARGLSLGEVLLAGRHIDSLQLAEAYGRIPCAGSEPLHLGELVGARYRVESLLGQGGMGAVYRVLEIESERALALKVILPGSAEEVDLLRFQREGEVAARLGAAAGFVRVHSGGQHRGLPYFVMDLVEGQDLESAFAQGLSEDELAKILAEVADALETCHRAGLVHRDLKPGNVLLGLKGPRVADLGLVRDRDAQTLTQSGEVLGTPAYMAPEQIEDARRVDARTDVYALGAILYRGLAGRPPFSGNWIHVLSRVVSEEPPPPSRVKGTTPSPYEGICRRAMAKDPEERYQDAASFAADLRRVLAGGRAGAAAPRGPRGPLVAALGFLLLGGIGAGLALRKAPEPEASATPRDTRALREREVALVSLEEGYEGLFSRDREVSLHALEEQSARVVARAEEAGLGPGEIREVKQARWVSARGFWSATLAEAAAKSGGDPAGTLARLRVVLLAPPALQAGTARVTSAAMTVLLERDDEANYRRAIDLHLQELPFGHAPSRLLQERAYARFEKRLETYPDCLRLNVPVQFGVAHFRVRQLVKLHPPHLPPGQLDGYLSLALQLAREWPNHDSNKTREVLAELREGVKAALAGTPDLGRRYVLELRYLDLRARTTIAEWEEPEEPAGLPAHRSRLEELAEEAAALRAKSSSVLVFELAEIEDGLWAASGEPRRAIGVWESSVELLKADVAASPLQDCPELFLGRSYLSLGYAQLRIGRPRECLESVERALRQLALTGPALNRIGAEAGFFALRFRAKAAGIAARAHLELGQLDKAEEVLEPYLNQRSVNDNHNLGAVAVYVAVARKDRAGALERLERFSRLEDEQKRYGDLVEHFQRELGEQD